MTKSPEKIKIEKRKKGGEKEERTEAFQYVNDLIQKIESGNFSFSERVRAVKSFVERESRSPSFSRGEEIKNFFLELSPDKLKEVLGERELQIASDLILERSLLFSQILANGIELQEVQKILKGNHQWMVPYQIRRAFGTLNLSQSQLRALFKNRYDISQGKALDFSSRKREKFHQEWFRTLNFLKTKNEKWQEYSKEYGGGEEKKPIKLKGFEELDFSVIKGEEVIRLAREIIFPKDLLSLTVEQISYLDQPELELMNKECGISGESTGELILNPETEKGIICLFKRENFLRSLIYALRHEWGHSLDSRIVAQKDLSPLEQLSIVKEWERIRSEEPTFSSYVIKINNPDKKRENTLKSLEDYAESMSYILENPCHLKEVAPKRYEFCLSQLKKRFPKFDLEENLRKVEKYKSFLNTLSLGKKDSIKWAHKEILKTLKSEND